MPQHIGIELNRFLQVFDYESGVEERLEHFYLPGSLPSGKAEQLQRYRDNYPLPSANSMARSRARDLCLVS